MLIINANINTMENENDDLKNGYLLCEDGKIKQLGDMLNIGNLAAAEENVIDAKGRLLLPGFIDAHCHIGMYEDGLGFEGDDTNEETDPVTPQLRAIDAVNPLDPCFFEGLRAGVTTVLTGPGSANPIAGQWLAMKTVGRRVDDMTLNDNIGMKFALGENPKVSYNAKSQAPATRMATAALIREQLKKALHYRQRLDAAKAVDDEDGESDGGNSAEAPEYDMKCEALLPVLGRTSKAFFHAHRADDIFTAMRISKEFNLDSVIIHATEGYKIADILEKENTAMILGPILCDRSKPELRELTVKNAAILDTAGLSPAICTDHPEVPIQYLSLSAAIACREGLPYDKALRAITINAARAVGLDKTLGSIKIGKDADFCLFTNDPLSINSAPDMVFVNGKLEYSEDSHA